MFAFNKDRSLLLQVTVDNRIFLWDAVTNALRQQYAEKYHLTAQYTCLSFGSAGGKKRKKQEKSTSLGIAALGSEKGKIVVWDLAKNEHKYLEHDEHTGKVNDVVLDPKCSRLFSCSESDKNVYEWDISTGKVLRKFVGGKPGVTRLSINSTGSLLLTAGPNIRLWDLETGEKLKRFVGHSSPVAHLSFINDNLIVSGAEDRFLSLWNSKNVKPKKAKKGSKVPLEREPVLILASPSPPQTLTAHGCGNDKYRIIVNGTSKELYGWDVEVNLGSKASKKSKEPNFALKRAEAVNVSLHSSTKLTVARSVELKPQVEEIELKTYSNQDDLDMTPSQDLNKVDEMSVDEDEKPKADEKTKKTTIDKKVKVVSDSTAKLATPVTKEYNKSGDEEDSEDEDEEDRPLGERVEEMSGKLVNLIENERKNGTGSLREDSGDESDGSETRKKRKREVHSASSLSTVLEQALQANDDDLMEVCLSQTDPKIVSATVKRLDSPRVRQFIGVIIKKFEDRPSRSPLLLTWISTLLKYHAEYLVTVPDLARSLGGLYETIEARLGVFKKLLKLSGRLDFLVSQVEVHAEASLEQASKRKKPKTVIKQQATILYDEERKL